MRTVFVGLCIAITALPVSVRILMDLGRLQSRVGEQIIGAAIANDVLALLVLGVILEANGAPATWRDVAMSIGLSALKVLLFMAAVSTVAWLSQRVAGEGWLSDVLAPRLRVKEPLVALTLLVVLGFAAFADLLGLHFVVGAFFGAVLLGRGLIAARHVEDVQRTVSGIAMGFLAPLFFATIGLEFDARTLSDPQLVAVILAAAFGGKILAGRIGGALAGLSPAEGWALGIGLNGRGIVELVVARIALANGFIGLRLFSVLVLMGVVTTMVTPVLLKRAFDRLDAERQETGSADSGR
jgi:Kef-type K+ transport system membrane component KefB